MITGIVIGWWLMGAGDMLVVASLDYAKVAVGGLGGIGVAAMGTAVGLGAGTFAARQFYRVWIC
ncbi:hypothetical protein [Vibrio alfacsensis]|uniref:hypothetical protein n=1 Tax=Vibrio alfacsensis TaxID=1074311 RepID=UPI004069756D